MFCCCPIFFHYIPDCRARRSPAPEVYHMLRLETRLSLKNSLRHLTYLSRGGSQKVQNFDIIFDHCPPPLCHCRFKCSNNLNSKTNVLNADDCFTSFFKIWRSSVHSTLRTNGEKITILMPKLRIKM